MRKQRNTMAKLNLFPKSLNYLGETKDPVRNLWRNVLIVALEDAAGKHWKNKNFGIAKGHYAESAQAYFLEPNRDFMTVCEYAGFDHRYVRMKARKFFERKKNDEKNMSGLQRQWICKSALRTNS
tara:strand:- start:307 stop:681 length:375 start_codon:yes stop_codon:yes gene_type:complete